MIHLIKTYRRETAMFILLIILCLITIFNTTHPAVEAPFHSKFLLQGNLTNLTNLIGMYGVFSIGVGLVIITAGIELSVGSLMSLLGVIFFVLVNPTYSGFELNHWTAAGAIILIGIFIGWFHGICVSKVKMQPFVVTLCGLLVYRGMARVISDDTSVSGGFHDFGGLLVICEGKFLGLKAPFWYLVIVSIIMYIVLHRSVFGRYIYAAGRNELATKYSGVNTDRVICAVYVICGFFTALSAIMFLFYTSNVSPSVHGNFYELWGIAAAVLGGCSLRGGEGTIFGILIGTTVLAVLSNMVNLLGLPSALDYVIIGSVIFFGVFLDMMGQRIVDFFKRIGGSMRKAVDPKVGGTSP